MFGERPFADALRAARAIATNQIARFAPSFYVELTGETGRGRAPASTDEIAAYHSHCFDDYLTHLGIDRESAPEWLAGKHVLEYGPGDALGVAFLFVAYGAESVICVDRFPLLRNADRYQKVLATLFESLAPRERARAADCFSSRGDPRSGLAASKVHYKVMRNGLSAENRRVSLAISRAVLEHVNNVPATFRDMARALVPGGTCLHLVDLKSHGLHQKNPLDFLTWPNWLWTLMYDCKGVPNRLRPQAYREAALGAGLEIIQMLPTGRASESDITAVRPFLAAQFRDSSDDELSWQGFWLLCRSANDR